jgi:hypothetical protein
LDREDGGVDTLVKCYSGVEYAERPVRFSWEGKHHMVSRICDERRTPEGKQFEVVDEEGGRFLIAYTTAHDHWTIRTAPQGKVA